MWESEHSYVKRLFLINLRSIWTFKLHWQISKFILALQLQPKLATVAKLFQYQGKGSFQLLVLSNFMHPVVNDKTQNHINWLNSKLMFISFLFIFILFWSLVKSFTSDYENVQRPFRSPTNLLIWSHNLERTYLR